MANGSGSGNPGVDLSLSLLPGPHLLVELDPWSRTFLHNLLDFVLRRDRGGVRFSFLDLNSSTGGTFWSDVFVTTRLPWGRFLESALYHGVVIAMLWALPRMLPPTVQAVPTHTFDSASVIYYSSDEYLPPLNSGMQSSRPAISQKGEPEFARQPIISVPPDSDNYTQTIVTPPDVKLEHDVALPNIVAWTPANVPIPIAATVRPVLQLPVPALQAVAPAPEVSRTSERQVPTLASAVIAPTPQVETAMVRSVQAPKLEVIEPPPNVEATSASKTGDINIGPARVIAPAPQLPVEEQRSMAERIRSSVGRTAIPVVPPPPLVTATGTSRFAGSLIALGIHPAAILRPLETPVGNRRGTFAATPEGRPGASGTPSVRSDGASKDDPGGVNPVPAKPANGTQVDLPPGLFVGPGEHQASASVTSSSNAVEQSAKPPHAVDPRLLANLKFPRLSLPPRSAASVDDVHATELDKQVFGPRRFYSMTLNMPNLNSMGGSWVIRFAELKENEAKGELLPPVVTQKVDPAYPAELMRTRVEGTITLYAVIHSDGRVSDVRVLRGADDRLDSFACTALARWHFRPATKNGNAVALEAVVTIPFRAVERP